MWTDEVVGALPLGDEGIELFDGRRQVGCGVEFVAPGAVATFDGAVEFGGTRRQHVELDVALLAGGFKFGHELGAAVDLDGLDGERHFGLKLGEEESRGFGGGAVSRLGNGPFGDRANSR